MNGRLELGRPVERVEQLARWWTSAAAEARFALLQRSVETNSPPLSEVRLAIILAETEAGEVAEG